MRDDHGHAPRIVILTGAGVSAESGVPTFRGPDGLWEGHRVEDVATPEAFARDPVTVHRFYNQRRRALRSVSPNPAHQALARLEQAYPGEVLLVTQNIDDLHERAGSRRLIHMHGELFRMRCAVSGRVFPVTEDVAITDVCACCDRPGRLRPHVVWFGEMPLDMERIQSALLACDLFVAIGTSGLVYPAAGFVALAREAGARTLEFNLDATAASNGFDEHRLGPAGETVPVWVEQVLTETG